ncbi:MAG: polysaccharide pyruvyl transferase WcaK-like protein [Phycisphaerales bacterium]|jgi:polysaccharide pyruvyl transferase WcaK-like protein
MKITFIGYYGFDNYGDDLFAVTCLKASNRFWPKITAKTHIKINRNNERNEPITRTIKTLYQQGSMFGSLVRLVCLARAVFFSNMIIFGGGSVFSSSGTKTTRRLLTLATKFKFVKIAAVGVSFGPFLNKKDELSCLSLLKTFSFISTRDQKSYEELKKSGVPGKLISSRDLAGVYRSLAGPLPHIQDGFIGIAPCFVAGDDSWQNEILFKAFVDYVESINLKVRVFVLNTHKIWGDYSSAAALCKELKGRNIEFETYVSSEGPSLIWEKIAECEQMVSVRLHGAVTAYLNNIPFLLIEYHKKCTEFNNDVMGQTCDRVIFGKTDYNTLATELLALGKRSKPLLTQEKYIKESLLSFTELHPINND